MADEVKVLTLWASPFGMRVLIALEEKGIPYTYQEEDIFNKSKLLLETNPIHKTVPVLFHNGKPICESAIIVQYIDEAWPGKDSLLPSDPYQRAQARFWVDFIDKKVCENGVALILRGNEAMQEEGKLNMIEYLGTLEERLGENIYFGGDEFGFVDVAMVALPAWLVAFETVGNWKIPFETDFPKLNAWTKRCSERVSVKKVLYKVLYNTEKIVEFAVSMRKKVTGN